MIIREAFIVQYVRDRALPGTQHVGNFVNEPFKGDQPVPHDLYLKTDFGFIVLLDIFYPQTI